MRRIALAAVMATGVMGVCAAPGSAAATRAEYIAQVDPICQPFVTPEKNAYTAYRKDYKEWQRRLSRGTQKAWEGQTHQVYLSLFRYVDLRATLTDQITAVSPAREDAATVSQWLTDRNRSERYAFSAAFAFEAFKFKRYYKLVARSNKYDAAGYNAISGFGFQACGVSA